MQKWRRKSKSHIIVEAELLTEDNVDKLANWSQSQIVEFGTEETLVIRHERKEIGRIRQGEFLVKVNDRFYKAVPSHFLSLYEPIEE